MSGSVLNLPDHLTASSSEVSPPTVDWAKITASIAAGDSDSIEIFYDAYFDFVFREIKYLIGRDEQTCLDILQETMLKIIRSIKPIDTQPQLTAWTRTVTKSVAFDWLRKQIRSDMLHEQLISQTSSNELVTDNESPETEIKARYHWIGQQLQQLPPSLQKMISLRYRWGWTLARISEKFGLETGAVDGRIRRAINNLKQQAEIEFHE